jgi:hypothetical protein
MSAVEIRRLRRATAMSRPSRTRAARAGSGIDDEACVFASFLADIKLLYVRQIRQSKS